MSVSKYTLKSSSGKKKNRYVSRSHKHNTYTDAQVNLCLDIADEIRKAKQSTRGRERMKKWHPHYPRRVEDACKGIMGGKPRAPEIVPWSTFKKLWKLRKSNPKYVYRSEGRAGRKHSMTDEEVESFEAGVLMHEVLHQASPTMKDLDAIWKGGNPDKPISKRTLTRTLARSENRRLATRGKKTLTAAQREALSESNMRKVWADHDAVYFPAMPKGLKYSDLTEEQKNYMMDVTEIEGNISMDERAYGVVRDSRQNKTPKYSRKKAGTVPSLVRCANPHRSHPI